MRIATNRNQDGDYLTIPQMMQATNLGESKVREIAKASGAARKIGGSMRIKKVVFYEYIDRLYA